MVALDGLEVLLLGLCIAGYERRRRISVFLWNAFFLF